MMEMGIWQALYRRILMLLSGGRINLTDDTGVVQRVQVTFGANQVGDKIPRVGEYGFASNPPAGTDCIIISVYGDRSISAVIATNNQQFRKKNLQPGEAAIYDNLGRWIYLKQSGIEIEANGSPVTVNDAASVTVNSNGAVTINAGGEVVMNTSLLKVSGDIIDNYNSQTHTMSGMRNIYNTHTHNDPQGGVTGPPNQPE